VHLFRKKTILTMRSIMIKSMNMEIFIWYRAYCSTQSKSKEATISGRQRVKALQTQMESGAFFHLAAQFYKTCGLLRVSCQKLSWYVTTRLCNYPLQLFLRWL